MRLKKFFDSVMECIGSERKSVTYIISACGLAAASFIQSDYYISHNSGIRRPTIQIYDSESPRFKNIGHKEIEKYAEWHFLSGAILAYSNPKKTSETGYIPRYCIAGDCILVDR